MKIFFVATALHKEFGGPPKAVVGAAVSLADIGHQVEILICGQSPESVLMNSEFYDALKNHGVRVRVLKSRRTSIYGGIGSLTENLETFKRIKNFDVISLHALYNFQNLIIASLCIINRKPFTLMPHGSLTRYQRRNHFIRKVFVNPIFFRFVLNPAKRIFVATQIEKDEINRSLQSKTDVVGLGITFPKSCSSYSESNTNRQTYNFLFMGRLTKKKRLDIAIKAISSLNKNFEISYKLIVCGDGKSAYRHEIEKIIIENSCTSFIDFRGWINDQMKNSIYSEVDCFILTSEDENFAIAVAESLSRGVPCVLSRNVALSELVVAHDAGEIFNSLDVDSVARVMRSVSLRNQKKLRDSAIEAARKLQWENVIREWEKSFYMIVRNQD